MNAIYEEGYWLPPGCDLLQRRLDLVQFDTAVNMGVGRAVRMLQGALGCAVDGDFGPITREAAETCDLGRRARRRTAPRASRTIGGSPTSGRGSGCS